MRQVIGVRYYASIQSYVQPCHQQYYTYYQTEQNHFSVVPLFQLVDRQKITAGFDYLVNFSNMLLGNGLSCGFLLGCFILGRIIRIFPA